MNKFRCQHRMICTLSCSLEPAPCCRSSPSRRTDSLRSGSPSRSWRTTSFRNVGRNFPTTEASGKGVECDTPLGDQFQIRGCFLSDAPLCVRAGKCPKACLCRTPKDPSSTLQVRRLSECAFICIICSTNHLRLGEVALGPRTGVSSAFP